MEKVSLRSSLDVVIRVKAAGINRADVLQRKGLYNAPHGASSIMGLEVSGIVEEIGEDVKRFKVGDKVMALVDGGGYAQYALAYESQVMSFPETFSFEEAASLPEAFLTAYQNIFLNGQIQDGQKILIHAGASGVGVASIQLCKLLKNITIVVTVGSGEKCEFCESLGARAINYKLIDWFTALQDIVGKEGVNIVFDCVGQSYFIRNIEALAIEGRLLMIGSLSGWKIENQTLDLQSIVRKRIRIEGSVLRGRSTEYKASLVKEFENFTRGHWSEIKPVIAKVFDWTDANAAHQFMEEDKNVGKIIIVGM